MKTKNNEIKWLNVTSAAIAGIISSQAQINTNIKADQNNTQHAVFSKIDFGSNPVFAGAAACNVHTGGNKS